MYFKILWFQLKNININQNELNVYFKVLFIKNDWQTTWKYL